MMPHGQEYPFGQFGLLTPAMSPPSTTCHPNFLAGVAMQKAGKALDLPSSHAAVKGMYPTAAEKSSDKPSLDKYLQMLSV